MRVRDSWQAWLYLMLVVLEQCASVSSHVLCSHQHHKLQVPVLQLGHRQHLLLEQISREFGTVRACPGHASVPAFAFVASKALKHGICEPKPAEHQCSVMLRPCCCGGAVAAACAQLEPPSSLFCSVTSARLAVALQSQHRNKQLGLGTCRGSMSCQLGLLC